MRSSASELVGRGALLLRTALLRLMLPRPSRRRSRSLAGPLVVLRSLRVGLLLLLRSLPCPSQLRSPLAPLLLDVLADPGG